MVTLPGPCKSAKPKCSPTRLNISIKNSTADKLLKLRAKKSHTHLNYDELIDYALDIALNSLEKKATKATKLTGNWNKYIIIKF